MAPRSCEENFLCEVDLDEFFVGVEIESTACAVVGSDSEAVSASPFIFEENLGVGEIRTDGILACFAETCRWRISGWWISYWRIGHWRICLLRFFVAVSSSVGDLFEFVRSFYNSIQEISFRESLNTSEFISVAPHHRRNFSSAIAEIFDRVDLIGKLVFIYWLWTFGSVDFVQVAKKSVDPFFDAGFLFVV